MQSHEPLSLDANATSDNQIECGDVDIAAMDRAIDKYLQDNHDHDAAQLALWPEEAVQLLLVSCNKDPVRHEPLSLDANATSDNQIECGDVDIAAMDRAIDKYLQDNHDHDAAQLALWPEEAVQLLLVSCTKDPSIRIRRAAISLLTSVVSRQQSAQEANIVNTLVLKCRDKDSKVQIQAYQMLVQLPIDALTLHLKLEDWRAVLDTALLGKQADDVDCTKQPEIYKLGTDLLHKYLKTTETLPLQYSTASSPNTGHDVCMQSAALKNLGHASQLLQALQLPWHNSSVHQAYFSALSNHAH